MRVLCFPLQASCTSTGKIQEKYNDLIYYSYSLFHSPKQIFLKVLRSSLAFRIKFLPDGKFPLRGHEIVIALATGAS